MPPGRAGYDDGMRARPPHRAAAIWTWAGALAAPAAATAACWLLDNRMSAAGLAMVYLLAVVAAAVALPRGPALLASVLGVSAFNFFFVPPRYSLAVDDGEYLWTLAVLLGLALALNRLVASLRERKAQAEAGRARAAALHELSESLAAQDGHQAMAQHAAAWLHDHLGLPCAVFLREGAALDAWASPGAAGLDPQAARWAIEHGRALGRGCDDWPDLPLWCAPFAGRDSAGAVQVLLDRQQARPAPQTLQHWLALARQAGLSIERARAAAQAQLAQDDARAQEARNTLLASLSHDLRTPLAGIEGSASALRLQGEAMTPAQRERLLANLENEARDLGLMADNVLQMARLSQPQWTLRAQWESVGDVLGAAAARMRRRWEGASIQLRVAADLPPVRAEASLLAQAVANLVDNAIRHSGGQAQVVIQAGRSRDGVFIAVRDHGRGLPPGDPQQLFERWRPGPASAGGAGLGLAICKLVVDAHAGRIGARRCDPGTELRIDLPAASREEPA